MLKFDFVDASSLSMRPRVKVHFFVTYFSSVPTVQRGGTDYKAKDFTSCDKQLQEINATFSKTLKVRDESFLFFFISASMF